MLRKTKSFKTIVYGDAVESKVLKSCCFIAKFSIMASTTRSTFLTESRSLLNEILSKVSEI